MLINQIVLKNFRNYKNETFVFDDKLTILIGPNGAGKSNILEGIRALSIGKSDRARFDRDLIMFEKEHCSLEGKVEVEDQTYSLNINIVKNPDYENATIKKILINKVPKSVQSLAGIFNTVLFSPQDINLLTGSPSERRSFIDNSLIQVDRDYKKALLNYKRAVKQRNSLFERISEFGKGYDQLKFWNEAFLVNGDIIQQKRSTFFDFINKHIGENGYHLNSGKHKIETLYKKSEISEKRLADIQGREINAKVSLIGPHRDDFSCRYNQYDVSGFGSRGQQRGVILSLKLAEISFIETKRSERPVLLLDDIFSELDYPHQELVLKAIRNQQTIITSAENPAHLNLGESKIINL